ncbi:MAG: peptidoglycan-associated lipoprotein Pal, partial [Patescibacteria group bacterium]
PQPASVSAKSVPVTQSVKKPAPVQIVRKRVASKTQVSSYDVSVHNIYFAFNSQSLTGRDKAILHRDAAYLKNNPSITIQIQGNCDRRGSEEYNLALGWRRANTAKTYLEHLGVAADRLKTISYGKEKPVCMAHTEVCYAKNRRDHFVVVSR